MASLKRRDWVAQPCEDFIQLVAGETSAATAEMLERRLTDLVDENTAIHEGQCINLDPATNVMNPKAEALLARGLSPRPSPGYPGDKYGTGLEAIERIEIMAGELVAGVFDARYVECRLPSGSMANLCALMATCRPGDRVIAPSDRIGGQVTHHATGAAGLHGLDVHTAPVDRDGYSVDLDRLSELARSLSPRLITIGGSLNLFPHPIREIRGIADDVGAHLLFDAAHVCGVIAGGAWPSPLAEGAHLMTMSTCRSLGGPPGGLMLTNDPDLAERLDRIAFPGLTAHFDVGRSAALAMALLDWKAHGAAYAEAMVACAQVLAINLSDMQVPVFASDRGSTTTHQFAIEAQRFGGGRTASKRLRQANFLASGIGLPVASVADDSNGIRIGTPEITRRGMRSQHMPELASLIARALDDSKDPRALAPSISALRQQFRRLHYMR